MQQADSAFLRFLWVSYTIDVCKTSNTAWTLSKLGRITAETGQLGGKGARYWVVGEDGQITARVAQNGNRGAKIGFAAVKGRLQRAGQTLGEPLFSGRAEPQHDFAETGNESIFYKKTPIPLHCEIVIS